MTVLVLEEHRKAAPTHAQPQLTVVRDENSLRGCAFDVVTARLTEVTGYAGNGSSYRCPVPTHDDHNPSLSVTQVDDRVLVNCNRGCKTPDILDALGLEWNDLFDNPKTKGNAWTIERTYDYTDENGRLLFQVVRYHPKTFRQRQPDGHGGWIDNTKGVRKVPYQLPDLIADGTVYVAEGEKDCDALVAAGVVATCNPGGAGKWRDEYSQHLKGANVVIVADDDTAGYDHARKVARSLDGIAAQVTVVVAKTGKDAADHLAAGHGIEDFVPLDLGDENAGGAPAPVASKQDVEDIEAGELAKLLDPSWVETDIGPVIDALVAGTLERPAPSVGMLSDGSCLFYANRVNSLFGESGDGKTWLALFTCVQEISAGHHVLYLDYEDRADGTLSRLLDLGAKPADMKECFHYFPPDEPYGLAAIQRVTELIRTKAITLVVVDSTGESMAVEGVKPNDDDAVARWGRLLPDSLARLRPAVVTLDHVTKAVEGRGLYAIGSQRKRAQVTGAAYMLDMVVEAGRGRAGTVKLTVAKDRGGHRPRGQKAAEFHLDATGPGMDATLVAPEVVQGEFQPTALMEKVSRYVELHPGASKNQIEKALGGKAKYVRQAVEMLVSEGYLEQRDQGQAHTLHHCRPYRQGGQFDSTSSPRPTSSQPRPGRGSNLPRPPRPVPTRDEEGDEDEVDEQIALDLVSGRGWDATADQDLQITLSKEA